MKKSGSQKGQGSVEMVAAVIVFCILLMTVISMSLFLFTNHVFLTAAREGARFAATDSRLGSNVAVDVAQAKADTRTRVREAINAATTEVLPDGEISVSSPVGVFGSRKVTVTITHAYASPIQVSGLMQALSGATSMGTNLDHFDIQTSAVMRYEE